MRVISLANNWQVKAHDGSVPLEGDFRGDEGWIPASVPGTVHQDLLAAGRIPDPFVGLHERDVQWVGERQWLYRCFFDLPQDVITAAQAGEQVALCFDGLDTFATAWLNGTQVLSSDNMFVPARVSVGVLLRAAHNELRLRFESALARGRAREQAEGKRLVWGTGDASRVYVRKAQYAYGWDWGPTLLTAGPWRPISLEVYSTRIADLHVTPRLDDDFSHARLQVTVALDGNYNAATEKQLHLELRDPDGRSLAHMTLPTREHEVSHAFELDAPRLWWPNGYGDQPLYSVEARLLEREQVAQIKDAKIGLRRLRLLQEPVAGEAGTSFVFEVNGTPIFCGGANWIPADSFLPRVSAERYREYLQRAADAHMVMLRVWGGGIYEEDIFYELCDELGLLVWQDFMFACGLYPATEDFITSVRREAEAALRRLRGHACLALWCGNNEDYMLGESLGVTQLPRDDPRVAAQMPARLLYERVLPELCARLDPERPYWPGSPYGGTEANDPLAGDRHTWEVWHGPVAPYQDYHRYAGRFVSEFGMQALPVAAAINAFAPPEERYPQSQTLEFHNKAEGGARRLATYLAENLRIPEALPDYLYATQLVQAEALATAILAWRRRWGRPGQRATAGALIWQLDDCWPGTSWAIIDAQLRPKPAYYAVRRALAPYALGLRWSDPETAEGWALNSTSTALPVTITARAWTLDGELSAQEQRRGELAANAATPLAPWALSRPTPLRSALVIDMEMASGERILARACLWPEPHKYLRPRDPELEVISGDGDHLTLRVRRPAKGVWLQAHDTVTWSDNLLDLIPGRDYTLLAHGCAVSEVSARWLR